MRPMETVVLFLTSPLVILLASMALFAALLRLAQHWSQLHVRVYRDFSSAEQGDWCSRVNSTIHACVIVPAMFYTLLHQEWDDDLMPLQSTHLAKAFFSFSIGYFLYDLYVIVHWGVPLYKVFVVHHIVAALPYVIYNFTPGCGIDLYLLNTFLLVEFAVLPLNIATFLEQLGHGKTPLHSFFYYTTYVCWFGARVLLPLYNVYVMWAYLLMPMATLRASWECVLPSAVCGHLIAAFCVGVFIFVWTPDLLAKWRAPVVELDEYEDYKLTLRQSITPRSSPLIGSEPRRSYGTATASTPLLQA
ncbi:TPA: hypothetical protein N0F65_010746 [Lagenidium giganteum]|uniref:TLC domain-containing protein n=1 Tax=Lagenidium giganteum TaxID=4803 RepID=A0AAV2YT22_9STRA|nr:TPA: hypothetical protein N0F65_010746 [Lagenidium giganteum]